MLFPHGILVGTEYLYVVRTRQGDLIMTTTNRRHCHCIECQADISPGRGVRFDDRPAKSGFLCYADARRFVIKQGENHGYHADFAMSGLIAGQGIAMQDVTAEDAAGSIWRLGDDGTPVKVD